MYTTAVNMDSRVQGLAGPAWTRESESNFKVLASPSIGLASPRVPASPREASPRVQRVGLVPALMYTNSHEIMAKYVQRKHEHLADDCNIHQKGRASLMYMTVMCESRYPDPNQTALTPNPHKFFRFRI